VNIVVLIQIALLAAGVVLALIAARRGVTPGRASRVILLALAVIALGVLVVLVVNQFAFPLHLDVMEGAVLQHAARHAAGLAVYPEPSPDFVALAYNPLFYTAALPFEWLLGVTLPALRLASGVAYAGCLLLVLLIVWRVTASAWWGAVAAGLVAAAYFAYDGYLNTAHADSWFVLCTLAGSALLGWSRTRRRDLAGLLVLALGFWFKQHGAFFVIGGVLYLTWRDVAARGVRAGLRLALPYWITAAVLGPLLYLTVGPLIYGPAFLTFTWEVPRHWSELTVGAVGRFARHVLRFYAVLTVAAGLSGLWVLLKAPRRLSLWTIQAAMGLLAGFLGVLDPGSADNIFIPLGVWLTVAGVLALEDAARRFPRVNRWALPVIGLYAAFAVLIYDPGRYLTSPDAPAQYADLTALIAALDGPVYAPWQAYLGDDAAVYPRIHWVALDDLTRGPGRDQRASPVVRGLLTPVTAPEGEAYILANAPLAIFPYFAYLGDFYVLEADFGGRFAALTTIPRRYEHAYPRYLWRFDPDAASAQ
jgi:hypothetical protein